MKQNPHRDGSFIAERIKVVVTMEKEKKENKGMHAI